MGTFTLRAHHVRARFDIFLLDYLEIKQTPCPRVPLMGEGGGSDFGSDFDTKGSKNFPALWAVGPRVTYKGSIYGGRAGTIYRYIDRLIEGSIIDMIF